MPSVKVKNALPAGSKERDSYVSFHIKFVTVILITKIQHDSRLNLIPTWTKQNRVVVFDTLICCK